MKEVPAREDLFAIKNVSHDSTLLDPLDNALPFQG